MTGTVKRVVEGRGFGFIKPDDGSPDVFFHKSELQDGLFFNEQLHERYVRFDVIDAERGPKAQTVEFADVGHAPMLMDPDQIAVVRDFLLAG